MGRAQLLRGRKMSGSNVEVEEKAASKQCSQVQVRPDSAWEGLLDTGTWRQGKAVIPAFFFFFLN